MTTTTSAEADAIPRAQARSRQLLTNVLVAVDVLSGAELALDRALALPCAVGARLSLMHAVAGASPSSFTHVEKAALSRRLEGELARAATGLDPSAIASLDIVPLLIQGRASNEIVRAAQQQGSELIVIGRHGTSSIQVGALGSTTERVVRQSGASVLVVSQPVRPYRRALVAIDFSETSRLVVELALRIISEAPSCIDAVHAQTARDEDTTTDIVDVNYERIGRARLANFLSHFLPRTGIQCDVVVQWGDPAGVILETAAELECDLIVLGARGHFAMERFLIGRVAEAVVQRAHCDVLVVRSRKDL